MGEAAPGDTPREPEKVLLTIPSSLPLREIETQSIQVRGVRYVFPSPEAVESELLRISGKMSRDENLADQVAITELSAQVVGHMKRGRAFLVTAKQEEGRGLVAGARDNERARASVENALIEFRQAQHFFTGTKRT